MRALVFAAGLGTRLKPFTLEHPKALVPVGGVPMLERVLRKLIAAGVNEIVVNVHHFSDQIIDFISSRQWGDTQIFISDESNLLLDTGGGILAARQWLDKGDNEPFIVHNADILTNFDILKMYDAHLKSNALATLLVKRRETQRYLLFNPHMRMDGWINVATGQVLPPTAKVADDILLAFGGVHVVSPKIFPLLEKYAEGKAAFPIMPFYIEECSREIIRGYMPEDSYMWHDIGKPQALEAACADISI